MAPLHVRREQADRGLELLVVPLGRQFSRLVAAVGVVGVGLVGVLQAQVGVVASVLVE